MVLIQDEKPRGRKLSIKGAPTSTSKPSKKWTYNKIHLSSPKFEEKKKSSNTKELVKLEKIIENTHSSNEITLPLSKSEVREKFSCVGESSRSEDVDNIEVHSKGEIISAPKYFKKSRK